MKALFLYCLLCLASCALAQERSDLQAQRNSINQQIEHTQRILQQTSKNRKNALNQLQRLQRKVSQHENSIKGIQQELTQLGETLSDKQASLQDLDQEIKAILRHYRRLLIRRYQYKKAARYLAAQHLSFGKRYVYLQHFELKRRQQLLLHLQAIHALQNLIGQLQAYRNEKAKLVSESEAQQKILKEELASKGRLAQELSAQEKRLREELAAKERQRRQLNNKIESVIRTEIAEERAAERKYPNAPNLQVDQKNAKALSQDFKQLKGRLPMPAAGKIVGHYGKHPHPEYPLVIVENNGIDIQTQGSSIAKAVHAGTVVSVFAIPGLQNAVMIKHGEYYTTYSNLSTVQVKRGQKVETGQALGSVGKDLERPNRYLLHFEIWRGKAKENPSAWIR
jgi:septal ring factor EnvC (AmiA/AmiB activator)